MIFDKELVKGLERAGKQIETTQSHLRKRLLFEPASRKHE